MSKIYDEIKRLLPQYYHFLSTLVKINSCYGREREAQLFIKSKMDELGLRNEIIYSRDDKESINTVSVIKGTDEKYKSLILNAHCDVSPIDNFDRWSNDPFSGEIIENILYGRGSQDDKAGVAIILLIAHVLQNLKIPLRGDLIIESVIEDETTGNGSKVLVDNGYIADGVIIVDGTWSERIIYGHLGQVWIDVEIIGEPVAACVEHRGINPIYIAINFIKELKAFIDKLNAQNHLLEGIDKSYFVNIGSFHSGVWHGSSPATCKLELQIGFSDKYLPTDIIIKVSDIAKNISDRIYIKESLLKTPSYFSKDNELILQLQSIIEKNSHQNVQKVIVTGHCDMRHFKTKNICLYGPGGGKNAHAIDEHYYLDQMPIVANNIIEFVLKWCNELR